ncbi:MAG: (Fe-S)-binding protein [Candidatus Bipolaricaulis sp.]|nr:(Fe-S)-binding protein [Candidatus Bipolaricaulis sp.]
MRVEEYKNPIYSCLRCGFCFDHIEGSQERICPSYVTYGMESYGARGKVTIARALVDGVLEYDADVARRVFACTECGACEEQCFKYLPLLEMYAAMKADLAERDLVPPELSAAARAVETEGNPYGKPQRARLDWAPGTARIGKTAPVLYFAGCTPSYVRRGIARAGYAVLEAAGADFGLLADETCCGHPFAAAGRIEAAHAAAEGLVAAVEASGARTVVFPCPGCLKTFREEYPRLLGRPLGFHTLHVTEFLAERIAAGALRLRKQSRIVAYHDPCTLGRGLGVYETPRRTIDAVPGAKRVELRRTREASFCCGSGALVRFGYEPMSIENEGARWAEAAATGADLVVSACPACQIALLDAKRRVRSAIDVQDVVEWVASAL